MREGTETRAPEGESGVSQELHADLERGAEVWVTPCGEGDLLFRAAARYPRARLRGIDTDEQAIGAARRRLRTAGLPHLSFTLDAPRSVSPHADWLLALGPTGGSPPLPAELLETLAAAGWLSPDRLWRSAPGALPLTRDDDRLTVASAGHLVALLRGH